MTKIIALIQARMSSSRFPGKVLEPLGGKPMIAFMVDRVRQARTLDAVAVVTSVDASDDSLAEALEAREIDVHRGDLDDVLSRYVGAAAATGADVIVRLTGDCPLIDPAIIDAVVALREASAADYASNVEPPTFADGLDAECFTLAALMRAYREAALPAEREHVTLWMRSEGAGLNRVCHAALVDSSALRLTVDYPDDLEVVRQIIALHHGAIEPLDHYAILRCLDGNRELIAKNRHRRNEALN